MPQLAQRGANALFLDALWASAIVGFGDARLGAFAITRISDAVATADLQAAFCYRANGDAERAGLVAGANRSAGTTVAR